MLADYVFIGIGTYSDAVGRPVPRVLLLSVLDAFEAVYRLRRGRSELDGLHTYHLLPHQRSAPNEAHDAQAVRNAIVVARRNLMEDDRGYNVPHLVGRSLYRILEGESLLGGDEEIHSALLPFWPALWALAARGHYAKSDRPVRTSSPSTNADDQTIPPLSNDRFTLRFFRMAESELTLLISFSEPFGPLVEISGYPKLLEFRRMVTELELAPRQSWNGRFFFGYTSDAETCDGVWVRGGGVVVGCSADDWNELRSLCQQAWDLAAVRSLWNTLQTDYGEL